MPASLWGWKIHIWCATHRLVDGEWVFQWNNQRELTIELPFKYEDKWRRSRELEKAVDIAIKASKEPLQPERVYEKHGTKITAEWIYRMDCLGLKRIRKTVYYE
ncbi:MAG: hypothetical protein ACFFCT_12065 [Candidatus Odinarchaeota archaeon]